MRHLMSPLDFSVEELDELLNLAKIPKNMHMHAMEKSLPPVFMNRAPEPVFLLKLPC